MADDLLYTEHSYGSHDLQVFGIWRHPPAPSHETGTTDTKYWLIYIHGGAWRDPRVTHLSAAPGIAALQGAAAPRVAGYASLSYRLSAHPQFPQADGTAARRRRAARHPDHVRDVRAALAALLREVGAVRYVLYGHSCGAALALQLLMTGLGAEGAEGAEPLPPPDAVVGFEGMYDLRALNARFGDAYRGLLEGAFGGDERVWDEASPARFEGSFREMWGPGADGKVAVLAYSPEDELIDMGEIDSMEKRLRDDGVNVLAYRDLKGGHDEVREDGTYIARVLRQTIEELDRLGKAH